MIFFFPINKGQFSNLYELCSFSNLSVTSTYVNNSFSNPSVALPTSQLILQPTGAQKWHIVSLLGDVTSPTTVADYVSMTCSEHRGALTSAPTADGLLLQAIRVQG